MAFSVYLLAMAIAWATAQALKYLISVTKSGRWNDTSSVLNSGNMPSVHTATVVSLVVVVGLEDGLSSGLFALSFILAAIVAYDAMGVRRSSGEQGLSLVKLLKERNTNAPGLALLGMRYVGCGSFFWNRRKLARVTT